MKCPKCGHENPNNELFCEECDFRMDQKPPRQSMDKATRTIYMGFGALALGIAAVVSLALNQGIFAIVFGAIGMVLGGYSISVVRFMEMPKNVKIIMVVLIAVALVTSVIGFLRGFMTAF